jgi:hypothetical protein
VTVVSGTVTVATCTLVNKKASVTEKVNWKVVDSVAVTRANWVCV